MSRSIRQILKMTMAAIAVSACAGDEPYVQESVRYPVLLSTKSLETRLSVDGTVVSWETDDQLSLTAVAADGSYAESDISVFAIDASDNRKASFTGFVTMPAGAPVDCYFTHPTGSAMQVKAETGKIEVVYSSQKGSHEPFMYAKTSYSEAGMSSQMKYIGAMLEIDMSDDMKQHVTHVSFVGNCLENLSPIVLDPETDMFTTPTEAVRQITVPVQSDGMTYIAVPPLNLTKGFTLVCSNADGTSSMLRSFSTDGSLSAGYDFSAKSGRIIPIHLDGAFEGFNISCSVPVVTHTTKDGLLNGTSVTFQMNSLGIADKLVEEWGAKLVRVDDNTEVRTVTNTNSVPAVDQTVTMDISNNWKLITAGTYVFAPYYKMYGQKISLPSSVVTVPDPGVKITISGSTSYDKYLAGNKDAANSHANTLISGVAASINVHPEIIDSYTATLDGATLAPTGGSGAQVTFGDLTRVNFKNYPMQVTVKVGAHTYANNKDFHLTGLPLEADFSADPSSWSSYQWGYLGVAGYSNKWVTFKKGTGGLLTPGFHVPANIAVKTAIDAHTNCSNTSDRVLYMSVCSPTQGSVITSSSVSYSPKYSGTLANSLSSQGYSTWLTGLTMTPALSKIMYSNVIDDESWLFLNQTRVGIFKIKIQYN